MIFVSVFRKKLLDCRPKLNNFKPNISIVKDHPQQAIKLFVVRNLFPLIPFVSRGMHEKLRIKKKYYYFGPKFYRYVERN